MRCGIILLLLTVYAKSWCQHTIRGFVSNSRSEPLQGVSIILRANDSSKIIAFAITGKDGYFQAPVTAALGEKFSMDFRHVGFNPKKMLSTEWRNPWEEELRIQLLEKPTELKEVVIRRELPVITKSDTVVFNASSYRDPEVRKVVDLLKKMQGFTVDASGKLSFNGKQVERVLIDGDDLAAEGYQMITRNLSAITVDKVEVINNFSDNRLLRKVVDSDKVGVNLKISPTFRSKISGSAEGGVALEGRYNADVNLIYITKGFKWLLFGNYNNTAKDVSGNANYYYRQEGGQLTEDGGSPVGPVVLENGLFVMPNVGDRYTRDNKDLGLALLNSWKIGKQIKVSAMIAYDDLHQINSASNSVLTKISDLEYWSLRNEMMLKPTSRDLLARISLHRDPGKKQVSGIDLVITKGNQYNTFSNISTGEISDSLSEKLKNGLKALRFKGQQTWLLRDKVLQVNFVLDYGSLDQKMLIGTSRFLSYWKLDSSYLLNRQMLGKICNRQELQLKINGKTPRLQYEYGLVSGFSTLAYDSEARISSVSFQPAVEFRGIGTNIRNTSYKGTLRLLFDAGKTGRFGLVGNSGIESIRTSDKKTYLFVYETSLGFTKKFGLMNSLQINYKLSRGFRKLGQLYPDQLMSGNATILNGLTFSEPELAHGLVSSINGNNLGKQRSWSFNWSYIFLPQRYVNGVDIFPQYLVQYFKLGQFSRMLNLGLNGELYVRALKSKFGSMVSFYSGRDQNSVNGVDGNSLRKSTRLEGWWISGLLLPVNAEFRLGTNYSAGRWNGGQSNTVWQYYWSYKLKLRVGKFFYGSILWNGQKVYTQKTFHGLDVFASYRLNPSMHISLHGVNLLNIRRIVDASVMPFSRSENVYILTSRYSLASLSWTF